MPRRRGKERAWTSPRPPPSSPHRPNNSSCRGRRTGARAAGAMHTHSRPRSRAIGEGAWAVSCCAAHRRAAPGSKQRLAFGPAHITSRRLWTTEHLPGPRLPAARMPGHETIALSGVFSSRSSRTPLPLIAQAEGFHFSGTGHRIEITWWHTECYAKPERGSLSYFPCKTGVPFLATSPHFTCRRKSRPRNRGRRTPARSAAPTSSSSSCGRRGRLAPRVVPQ